MTNGSISTGRRHGIIRNDRLTIKAPAIRGFFSDFCLGRQFQERQIVIALSSPSLNFAFDPTNLVTLPIFYRKLKRYMSSGLRNSCQNIRN